MRHDTIGNKKRAWKINFQTELALYFGTLCGIILLLVNGVIAFGIPGTSDVGWYGENWNRISNSMEIFVDTEKDLLINWFNERKGDMAILAKSDLVRSRLGTLLHFNETDSLKGVNERRHMDPLVRQEAQPIKDAFRNIMQAHTLYRKIQLVDIRTGIVIVGTTNEEVGTQLPEFQDIAASLSSPNSISVIVERSCYDKKPCMVIAHAVAGKPGETAAEKETVRAVIVAYMDVTHLLTPLSYDPPLVGDSEEIILIDQQRHVVVRYSRLSGIQIPASDYRMDSLPTRTAGNNREGLISDHGYYRLSVPVLAAYRYVSITPDFGWGLLMQVPQADVRAMSYRGLFYIFLKTLAGVAVAGFITALIAGRISRPVQDLTHTAREVEAGNLNARATIFRSDEMGILANTFNLMIDRIQHWHRDLEDEVAERTLRLTWLNQTLTTEIEKRKLAQTTIQQQNVFLQTVLESLSHPFYVINAADCVIKAANSAALKGQSIQGLTCHDLVCGSAEPCNERARDCPISKVHRSGKATTIECVWSDTQNNTQHTEIHAHPFFDNNGNVIYVIGYSLDITERILHEQEREHLIAELEAKNREMESFTYIASHDLKSPLITIKGFLGYLDQDIASGNLERMKSDTARIHKAVDKMTRLLDELLELSRIGRFMNPPRDVSLRQLVEAAMEALTGPITAGKVDIEIEGDLPMVYGDEIRLQEVFQNLLDNALKFMGNQPHPKIRIGAYLEDDHNIVYIKDNGIGIDPKYYETIFQPFDRLDPNVEGSGIGLPLVKRIVLVHGGKIWVESGLDGQGSTFYFALPIKRDNGARQG